ncbi:hypothetical protein [Calothrix sp. NIES-2098]|uniref:hypothetical protein n=1 Tax=Calothrix sp. NIES-2098 TaxID=1954171 RepID=UPI000B606E1D|nr:hypothetical protein NIES2098_17850 [Calothrix sp. NIES-2098]
MDNTTSPDNITNATKNDTELQLIAAELTTEPEILRKLALSSDKITRQLVVANPNTPTDVLFDLGAEFPSELLDNPVFSLLFLENPNLVGEIPLPTVRSILRLENVPVYILEKLADKSDYKAQALALVNNPQNQKLLLNRMNQISDSLIVESARLHINLAGELTEGYEQKIKEAIQGAISGDRHVFAYDLVVPAQICYIPEFIVECWVREPIYEHYLCRNIAYSPATAATILKHLAKHTDGYTRDGVAHNLNTPPEVLRELANKQESGEPRIFLARNINTPSDVLESLSKDRDEKVRIGVAENPNTPLTVLQNLANDTNKEVAQVAAKVIGEKQGEYTAEAVRKNPNTPPHMLEKLAQKDPHTVCQNPNTPPELLLEFSKSANSQVRECVAKNPNTPVNILEQLADDDSSRVRQAVAQNPNTPISALEKLARDEDGTVRMHTASKINLSPEILEELAVEKSHSEVRRKAMLNPSLSKEAVEHILCGEYAAEYLKLNPDFLSRHPDSKARVINYYAQSECFWVRFITLLQPEISQEFLQEKSLSIYWLERLAVAQNPQAAEKILNQLAKDGNQLVRAAAKATSQHLC